MKYFLLETQGDNGKLFLKTNASNKETAILNFCNLYFAPPTAVKKIYEIELMFWNFKPATIIKKRLFIK